MTRIPITPYDDLLIVLVFCPDCGADPIDHCGYPCGSWTLGCHAPHDDDCPPSIEPIR
jgi:hypothetical protein